MAEYLREDLLANGINPDSLEFGGNPDLNVGGAMSISKNLKTGLKDESKPLEAVTQTINYAQEVEAPKCPGCQKNLYRVDDIIFLENGWHKDCFVCGLGNSIGCKRPLLKGEFETHSNIAYCKACYAHNFQLGAARGALMKTDERSNVLGNNPVKSAADAPCEIESKSISVADQIKNFNKKSNS